MSLALHQYPARVPGVSVDEPAAKARDNILRLVGEVAKLYGDPPLPEPQVQVCDRHIGPGYAVVSELERRAISLLAREEGILLDPVYTGRALGGLMSAIERGEVGPGERVLLWHTGGLPSLFQLSQEVMGDA
ncbi:MAG: pyridoxal-phosphate dependent enzyme [Deltaproteobacteria bacterium]|nr:pyridoxal-phosphate dependent enzyme [Deltaproteobacteria bacterium]